LVIAPQKLRAGAGFRTRAATRLVVSSDTMAPVVTSTGFEAQAIPITERTPASADRAVLPAGNSVIAQEHSKERDDLIWRRDFQTDGMHSIV
jgi:hypothetical protein